MSERSDAETDAMFAGEWVDARAEVHARYAPLVAAARAAFAGEHQGLFSWRDGVTDQMGVVVEVAAWARVRDALAALDDAAMEGVVNARALTVCPRCPAARQTI